MPRPITSDTPRLGRKKNARADSPEYRSWQSMRQRCTNARLPWFERYGGRGVSVCKRWASYERFLADMGPRPKGTSLDRFPNQDGDYKPSNCRWATKKEQNNNRRNNLRLKYCGRVQTLQQWCDELGMPKSTVHKRILAGWPIARAITQKVREMT